MLPALHDNQRSTLVRASLMLCIGALCTLPFAQASSSRGSLRQSAELAHSPGLDLPGDSQQPPLLIGRDPFEASRSAVAASAAAAMSQAIVRAVVLGERPRALVEIGGTTSMFEAGDRLAGSSIVVIDASGVLLANGVSLGLSRPHP